MLFRSLTPYIRWYLKALRRARAVEGVYLPAAMNEDSAKLILHTLPDISGWPSHLRVEVWERAVLIDSIGPTDGPLKRVLEPVAGHYQAYIPHADGSRQSVGVPGHLLPVLLGALPALERQAFGYTHASGVEELVQEIGQRLGRKEVLADNVLNIGWPTWHNPPRRVADGRVGYPLSGEGRSGGVNRGQVARFRQLFPTKSDTEAAEILQNVSDSFQDREDIINYLFKEQDTLKASLERWCLLGEPANLKAQLEASERILKCWRKEDSPRGVPFELYLDGLSLNGLPELSAHFGHVVKLSVRNNQLQDLPAKFLR